MHRPFEPKLAPALRAAALLAAGFALLGCGQAETNATHAAPAPAPERKEKNRMSQNVMVLSEGSFDSDVLKSPKPVLVDFWAVWCGPCRQIEPIVENLAVKWGEKATVAKLNVDDAQRISERYGVMSIPTLMLFKDGQIVERVVGLASQATLERKFEPHIN